MLWEFGALGVVSYDNAWRNRERIRRDVTDPINLVETKNRTINQVSATGVVNLGFNFTDDHEITTNSFFLRNTEDETAISTRTQQQLLARERSAGSATTRFGYEERELTANQIRGHHVIGQDTQANTSQFLDRGCARRIDRSSGTCRRRRPKRTFRTRSSSSAEDRVDPATGEVLSTAIRQSDFAARLPFHELEDEVDSNGWDITKAFAFENIRCRAQLRPRRRRQGSQLYADSISARDDHGRPCRADPRGDADGCLHGRQYPEPAQWVRADRRRHRHGELSRGADRTTRLTSKSTRSCSDRWRLRGRRALGGVPAGFACRSNACSTIRGRPVRAGAVRRGGARAHHVRRG